MAVQPKGLYGRLIRDGRRVGLVASVHALRQIVQGLLFDAGLYGAVVTTCTHFWGAIWGPIIAFGIMCPLAGVYCYYSIRFYDWSKKDLLGLEALKSLRENRSGSRWTRFVQHIARKGDAWAFVALSMYGDAILVVIYLRKGVGEYNGLSPRDWNIFWASVIVSNIYWIFRWTVLVEAVRFVW